MRLVYTIDKALNNVQINSITYFEHKNSQCLAQNVYSIIVLNRLLKWHSMKTKNTA